VTDHLANLNPEQRAAVVHGDGPLLVFAGAGSGKTRVITHRIAHLVRDRGVKPWNILAVTFTNKAAGEMRTRVGGLIGEGLRDTWIGTFHATCAKLLRQHAAQAGLAKDFVIFDDGDQKAMVTRCLRDLGLDDKRFPARAVQGRINAAKQDCVAAADYDPKDWFDDQVRRVYLRYEEQMRVSSAVDFGDLLFRVVCLLEGEPAVAAALQRRFRHLLVDEFQDTNHVQYRLLRHVVGPERNLCVVGDDDQSIYRWRGADVRNILGFREDFPDALIVTLEQNYRSTKRILASAVAVIKRNRTRAPKTLWTDNPPGEKLRVVTLADEREEAAYAVRTIKAEIAAGRDPGEVAVFYRINAQARVIEEALRAANVAYRVVGGMKFYERAEIKDLIAYLRVIHNPLNDVDLVRIINNPPRRIGQTTVDRLLEVATAQRCSLWDVLSRLDADGAWSAATRKRLVEFRDLVVGLRELNGVIGPAELALAVLDRTGYLESLKTHDSPEADSRIENLEELVGSFAQYEREADEPSLAALLESISLVQDVDGLEDQPKAVTLMTVHSAKGLEFPVVLLTGMEEDIFPYRRASDEVDDQERQEQVEEERRLAYVAITRARRVLHLTNVARRRLFGTERYNVPSRFLEDLPPDAVEVVDLAGAGAPVAWGGSFAAMTLPGRLGDERGARRAAATGFSWTPSAAALPARRAAGATSGAAAPRPGAAELKGVRRAGDRALAGSCDPPEPVVVSTFDDTVDGGVELRPGMSVRHETFGVGLVRRVLPGVQPKVAVDFPGHGSKTLMARFLRPA
jgi:DNA helicase-2/ATP-dependent DNA helicase PcrA